MNAANYKGVVEARVAAKKNTMRKGHPDAHHAASLVRFALEFGALFGDFVDIVAYDDKAKLKVGSPAVSRYHQMCKFFLENDMPNFQDHDFPDPGSLITPSSYLHLKFINAGEENDCVGRKRIKLNRTGALKVVNRAFKFHSSTANSHAADLYEFITERNLSKPGMLIISDGGWDCNVKSDLVFMSNYRLWRKSGKDFLATMHYAPGYSAYNPFERAWSPLSKALSGVVFSNLVPGEVLPPFQQNLTAHEEEEKMKIVLDNAGANLCQIWNGL